MKFAYLLSKGFNPMTTESWSHSWIWKAFMLPKVQILSWFCLHCINYS